MGAVEVVGDALVQVFRIAQPPASLVPLGLGHEAFLGVLELVHGRAVPVESGQDGRELPRGVIQAGSGGIDRQGMALVLRALCAVLIAVPESRQRDARGAEAPFDAFADDLPQLFRIGEGHQGLRRVQHLPGQALRVEDGIDGGHVLGRVEAGAEGDRVAGMPQVLLPGEPVVQRRDHHGQEVHPFPDPGGVDVAADDDGLRLAVCRREVEKHQQGRVRHALLIGRDLVEGICRRIRREGEIALLRIAYAVVCQEAVRLACSEMGE